MPHVLNNVRHISKIKGMIRTVQTGLEIAQDSVNPKKLVEFFRLAPSYDNGMMLATRL